MTRRKLAVAAGLAAAALVPAALAAADDSPQPGPASTVVSPRVAKGDGTYAVTVSAVDGHGRKVKRTVTYGAGTVIPPTQQEPAPPPPVPES